MFRLRRRQKGSAITETGPALFILLICIFFPMMNIIQLGAAYAISQLYHDYMIREIACSNPADGGPGGPAQIKINNDFNNNPLFNFVKIEPGQFNVSEGPVYILDDGQVLNSPPPKTAT